MNVAFSPRARADIISIVTTIAKIDKAAADAFIEEVERRAQSLTHWPNRGMRLPRHPALRRLLIGRYVMIYRKGGPGVEIVRLIHGARDLKSVLAAEVRLQGRDSS